MSQLNKSIAQIWSDDYVVPLYQRNYAWQESQIQQLLQDIYDNSKNPESYYFIGSLVVLQRPDGAYEVIDGQQRLTTLHLICKSLNLLDMPHLTYDSRPEVEEFFRGLFASATCKEFAEKCKKRDCRKTYRLVDAIDIVENTDIHMHPGYPDDRIINLSSMDEAEKVGFKKYLNNNVIIVRTVLPCDTDVAAYFEIMNNRGEQLQEHEIVKALMMKELSPKERSVFSTIWDACSQMNVPIQKSLAEYRNYSYPLFGENFDTLHWEDFISNYHEGNCTTETLGIDEILSSPWKGNRDYENAGEVSEDKYEPIVDFPNFLMHIFKQYDIECQLNSNYLLDTYHRIKSNISSMEFIQRMLKSRTLFDRFVIKSQGDGEEDENLKWVMLKPYLFTNKRDKSHHLRYRNTFSMAEGNVDENEKECQIQRRIIMQESMLQVTFRNKKYKNWLYDLLQYLGQTEDVNQVDASSLSDFLDSWILDYYKGLEKKTIPAEETSWAFAALGTETPHFVFNLIDYLYWVASKNAKSTVRYLDEVDDFNFKYYNSIEHHLPQSYVNTGHVNVDALGNLCLISRKANSSLNDKAPKEKAVIVPDLQPKRKIMYLITQYSDGMWGQKQISEHEHDVKTLLDERDVILRNKEI